MFTAKHDGQIYRFRKMNALARRLGGTSYSVCHSTNIDPPTREVHILRKARYNDGAYNIVATVWVPSESIPIN